MKKGFERALILSLSIAIVLLITAGCQEQTTTTQKGTTKAADKAGKQVVIKTEARQTGEAKAKTTGAENIELKKELAKCEAEKAAMEKEMDSIGEETLKVFEENIKLQEDVNNLKMHIEQIEAENKPK